MSEIDWAKAPEGATHYWPGNSRFYEKVGDSYFVSGQQNYGPVHSTESWVKNLIPRPSTAWSGDGLPPVGVDVEFNHSGLQPDEWVECHVVGYYDGHLYGHTKDPSWKDRDGVCHLQLDEGLSTAIKFRPIRTPEQVAADERSKSIALMIPIAKLGDDDEEICAAFYDAGLRFTEQPK